jgi:phosphoribosylamine-glycine ligase
MDSIKKAIVLAGGNDQIALINKLRNKFNDIYIYLVDYAENPVAKTYADEHLRISTMDQDAVLKVAKEKNVDLVIITCGDQPLPIMAYVSEQLKLPTYLSFEQAVNLTNKMKMKELMVSNNIPTAKYKICTTTEDINISNLKFPLIVKPSDCNGSKGVRKVQNEQELLFYLDQALNFSRSHTAIIEEFKDGIEISVDAYICEGNVFIILMSQLNKYYVDASTQIIYQSVGPAQISDNVKNTIQDIAYKISKAFSLYNSPLLIQVIVNGDEVNVVEFSARIGGGAKYQTIEKVTGFDILGANVDAFFDKKTDVKTNEKQLFYSRCHLYTKGGILGKITGLDELVKSGEVDSVTYTKTKGTMVTTPHGSSDRVASFFVLAEDFDSLNSRINKSLEEIKIYDEDGNDITFREMYQI